MGMESVTGTQKIFNPPLLGLSLERVCVCVWVCCNVCGCVSACMCDIWVYVCLCMFMRVHMWVYLCMYVWMHVCVLTYMIIFYVCVYSHVWSYFRVHYLGRRGWWINSSLKHHLHLPLPTTVAIAVCILGLSSTTLRPSVTFLPQGIVKMRGVRQQRGSGGLLSLIRELFCLYA